MLDYQREIAAAAVESGVDVIVGHHPHVIQGVEVINGKPVFYSLGNFIFGWEKMQSRHRDGIAIECEISDRKMSEVRIRPVWRDDSGRAFTADIKSDEGKMILKDVSERSQRFSTLFAPTELGLRVTLSTKH